jgi:altronate dehydratase
MIWLTLITALALSPQAQQASSESAKNEPVRTDAPATAKAESAEAAAKPVSAEANASALNAKLLTVTRIYVDDFGADPVAKQIQAMVVNSISESKRFIITENKEKADAILKGTALEKTSQESHSYKDKAAAVSGFSGVAADDSSAGTETIHDARVAVRLVAADGDVIWSTTQESRGAKYKGASADVADKVIKRLMSDLERMRASTAGK